jgi:hypothetical protein
MILIIVIIIILILYITKFNNEYFDEISDCQIILPFTEFKINDLDINFTLNQNIDGDYNVVITDNKQNIYPNYNQNGIVMLKCNDELYLKKTSGDWLSLENDHPNIVWKYTLPSMYKKLNNKLYGKN